MKTCSCCKQNDVKPTFSFYCRFCYNYLQQKCNIDVADYVTYFQVTYNKIVSVEDCSFGTLRAIHDRFQNQTCY